MSITEAAKKTGNITTHPLYLDACKAYQATKGPKRTRFERAEQAAIDAGMDPSVACLFALWMEI